MRAQKMQNDSERGENDMRGKKIHRSVTALLLMLSMGMLAGCQKTPDDSAVANRAGGLPEDAVVEPLSEGETQTIELPDKWEQTEKWNKDRWIFETDVDLESIETGNLPVVEIEQRPMTQEELENLVDYFADGQELYKPLLTTKDEFQDKLDRIQNGEGIYAVYSIDTAFGVKKEQLEKGLAAAPETNAEQAEAAEIAFSGWQTDPGNDAASEREKYISGTIDAMPIFFSADVGENRDSQITARKYDPDAGLSGTFEWLSGDALLYQKYDIDQYRSWHSGYQDVSDTDRQWEQLLDECTAKMSDENIEVDSGRTQAEAVLADLGITDKIYAYAEPVLWFPDGSYPEDLANTYEDSLWQSDLSKAEPGYAYTFVNAVGGQPVDFKVGGSLLGSVNYGQEEKDYSSPFKMETVTVAVTGSGVKMFSWEGMSEVVSTVADNVKILPFEELEERAVQYISFYFPGSQPEDDETLFKYELQKIQFGYTYMTAYDNPDHAWAVPAWFLELKSGHSRQGVAGTDELDMNGWVYFTVSAIDGGGVEN